MDESAVWVVFFSGIAAMAHHPGASRDGAVPLTMAECANVADAMLEEYRRRFYHAVDSSGRNGCKCSR